jgi:glucosyl-3-phosphoglycerate synthase
MLRKGDAMNPIHESWEFFREGLTRAWRATVIALRASEKQSERSTKTSRALIEPTVSIKDSQLKATVVIPALNEARHIADVVAYAFSDPATAEVIVIDDSSTDETANLASAAGAKVIRSTMLGKGESMRDGAETAASDIVVYLDGDLHGLRPNIISDLIAPIQLDGADFVKAKFGRGGGRVTELTAKPMLRIFFPELTHFAQPLGGIVAAKKSLLKSMRFESDYGVDVGLLIDAYRAGAALAEVNIGSLKHESQSLPALGVMAQEVSRTIFERAKEAGRLSVDQVLSIYENERDNRGDIDVVQERLRGASKLVLLCMSGVVTKRSYFELLAKTTRSAQDIAPLLSEPKWSDELWHQKVCEGFRFVHRNTFEKVARQIELRPNVIESVNELRRMGYKVGVVTDGYFVAAEIVRRRIFADFALGNFVQFEAGVCQGKVRLNRAFAKEDGCREHAQCTSNALHHLRSPELGLSFDHVIAVGAKREHRCLLRIADFAFGMSTGDPELLKEPGVARIESLTEIVSAARIIENEALVERRETALA